MDVLKSFKEKPISLAATAVLALGLSACSDMSAESKKNSAVNAIANDVNGEIENGLSGEKSDAGNSEVAQEIDAGAAPDAIAPADIPTTTDDADAEPDATAPDVIEPADIPTITDDADAEPDATAPDVIAPADIPTTTDDADAAADAIAPADIPTTPEDSDANDSDLVEIQQDADQPDAPDSPDLQSTDDTTTASNDANNDITLAADIAQTDAANSSDTLVAKGICTDDIVDKCLQQFKQAMCVDPCNTTDKQVEGEIQLKIDELVGDFDKVVSNLSKPPKSLIWVGKEYEIIDGNVTWTMNIKTALMDPSHIEYRLKKVDDDGTSQELTWLVSESTLIPEKVDLRTDTTKPCFSFVEKTVDVPAGISNAPSVKSDTYFSIIDVPEVEEECKTLDGIVMQYAKACSTNGLYISKTNQCDTGQDPKTGKPKSFPETKWENSNYVNAPQYKDFIIKTFAQVQDMLKKHGMDITN